MRNKLNLLIVGLLAAVSVFAQQGSVEIDDIMDELMNYKEEPAQDAEATLPPATKTPSPSVEKPTPPPAVEDVAKVAEPDVPSEMDAATSRVDKTVPSASSDMPVEVEPEQVRIEERAVSVEPDMPVEKKEPVLPRNEDTEALAMALNVEFDELVDLMEGVNKRDAASREALQERVDLITNEPEQKVGYAKYLESLRRTVLRSEPPKRQIEVDAIQAVDDAWSMDLVLRSYPLVSDAAERMKLGNTTSAVDVGMLFSLLDSPEGSSAIYQPETQTLFVKNTVENLAVLETMMKTMGVLRGFEAGYHVEIEARFVEVSEGTLEELGFQWNFADPTTGGDYEMRDGPDGLFSDGLRGSPVPFDRPADLGDGTIDPTGDWSTFRFADTFNRDPAGIRFENTGGNEFELLISALDQNSGADVLSAPRILTRSGEEANIQVGELHYFPEVYEGDSAQATIVNISYEDFSETLLGVELTVTPKVNDNREIMLELNPRISEFAGWQSYQLLPGSATGFGSKGSHYNHRQLDTSNPYTKHDPIIASLPIFKKREIETQVTMADGSTIGMGGLIHEKIEKFEDNVPVLGNIPMVGRLFRSEGERVIKVNLLMFVTARIIEPNGMATEVSRSFE